MVLLGRIYKSGKVSYYSTHANVALKLLNNINFMLRIHQITLIIGTVLLTFCCSNRHQPYQPTKKVVLSDRLERIKMSDLKGKPFTLHNFGGRPVFLNFWATWCRPCISEMRSMEELHQRYKGQAVFLAVTTEDVEKIKKFKAENDFTFEFAKLDVEYIDAFVITLPTTLLINREGKMLYEEEGARIWTSYNNEEKLKECLK